MDGLHVGSLENSLRRPNEHVWIRGAWSRIFCLLRERAELRKKMLMFTVRKIFVLVAMAK